MLENLKSKLTDKLALQGARANYILGKGLNNGARVFLKSYEAYRIIVGIVFLCFFIYFLLSGNFLMSFVSFGFFHLHVTLNQVWWKLRGMEQVNED